MKRIFLLLLHVLNPLLSSLLTLVLLFLFCFSNVYSTFLFAVKSCHMDCFDCFHDMQMNKDFKKMFLALKETIFIYTSR